MSVDSPELLDRYSRQVRYPALGEAGQRQLAGQPGDDLRLRCARDGAGQPPRPRGGRAGSGSSTATSSRRTTSSARSSSTSRTSPTTCPRPRPPRGSSGAINSAIAIEPVVTDIDHTNILDLVGDADLILDGTDNFETRYLINDAAVKLGKPWIFGGVIGSEGQTMTIIPGETPCIRCLIETSPPPGMTPTCETAGVLGPAVAVIASFEAVEAIKILSGALRCA